jgi:transcriptional regulator GlxA family with amidase domain
MTATMDLVLAMIKRDIGPELARAVAKPLVIHHRRAGGQARAKTKTDRLKRTSFHPSSVRL